MKKNFLLFFLCLVTTTAFTQAEQVSIVSDDKGMKLVVNGKDFIAKGVNWDYFPIGTTNPSYNFWGQPDDFIKAALDAEMSLLKNMGVNVLRLYVGVKPKWIRYIYQKYGIYTMLNHTFGRYGVTLPDGSWMGNTEYADPRVRELLISEARAMVEEAKGTPGLLMYMLGNENNYGLFWEGAETEDIPIEERKSTVRATAMYKLFNDATLAMKQLDASVPVAMCNGDLLFIEIIKEECKDVDVFGTNMYRGISFGDAFQKVKDELNKPILFAEFGADAFNAVSNQEDQMNQAYYNMGNWQEIYENAYGLGKAGNSIGGFTFQFSDGWWKMGQTDNLNLHDNTASWANGGYEHDFVEGDNNMNEEWFGICAKGPTNPRGLYELFPRAAYYAEQEAHRLNPYAAGTTLETIGQHFSQIELADAMLKARGDKAALIGEEMKRVRVSEMRAELSTYSTGGSLIETPEDPDPTVLQYPDELGFDHMQSYFVGVEANPAPGVRANVSVNILGNVAENPINEIFYENRGRVRSVSTNQGPLNLGDINRLQVYQGDFSWDSKHFNLTGFFRTGHYHWGYEGDFFGLYPEANYGPNIDIYNGSAPLGFEFEGKKSLEGFKAAFGPELWWGANPAVLLKYSKKLGDFDVTGIYHEDIDKPGQVVSSIAVPSPQTRRVTLHVKTELGPLGVEVGGIWGGQPLVGRTFQMVRQEGDNTVVVQDEIQDKDTWGGKAKLTFSSGRLNWYAQGAAMGLVANGGADNTLTFTGWRLRDSGSGNQFNFLTGFTYLVGDLQIAPNFLWQKPVVDPMPGAGNVPAPGRARNILDDPFAVRGNRETVGGEILFTYDPTPGTWMYDWDSDIKEDAKMAVSAGFVYRHLPTIQDAGIGIFADGRTLFPFANSAPAEDLWEAHARIVSKINPELGIIANIYGGNGQANGSDPRLIHRYGADVRMIYKKVKLRTFVKIDDWGPYDYHRDFNQTYPLQIMADLSTWIAKPDWFDLPNTRIGARFTWRSLDEFSPRYCPATMFDAAGDIVCDPEAVGFDNGSEWELSTYVHFSIGR